jgi:hypothetical protein
MADSRSPGCTVGGVWGNVASLPPDDKGYFKDYFMASNDTPFRQLVDLFKQAVYQGEPSGLSDAETADLFLAWLVDNVDDPVVRQLLDQCPAELRGVVFRHLVRNGEGHS